MVGMVDNSAVTRQFSWRWLPRRLEFLASNAPDAIDRMKKSSLGEELELHRVYARACHVADESPRERVWGKRAERTERVA